MKKKIKKILSVSKVLKKEKKRRRTFFRTVLGIAVIVVYDFNFDLICLIEFGNEKEQ